MTSNEPRTWLARVRLTALIVAGFGTLIATSAVEPGTISNEGYAQSGLRITLKRARGAGSSSISIDGRTESDPADAGASSGQVALRARSSGQVVGLDGATDWHALCASLDDCTLEFDLEWPAGEAPEVVMIRATLTDTLRASGPICTAGESFDKNASVSVESID